MGAAMKGSMLSLRENGAQHGGHGLLLRISTFQSSTNAMLGFCSAQIGDGGWKRWKFPPFTLTVSHIDFCELKISSKRKKCTLIELIKMLLLGEFKKIDV